MGASLYACLSGVPPPTAAERLEKDRIIPARKGWAGRYSAELLDTLDGCLRPDHLEHPQSVLALQKALSGEKLPGIRGDSLMLEQLKSAIFRLARR